MITLGKDIKIYIGTEAVDMRKSINGLSLLVVDELSKNPQSGHIFIFYNKQRNKLKLILWDKNGFFWFTSSFRKDDSSFQEMST